jgi:predicted nucleotidyltransferase
MIDSIKKRIQPLVKFPYSSMYLFGSYAREEQKIDSDIDILIVSNQYNDPIINNEIAISVYSIEQLVKYAQHGSLFVLHLILESVHIEGTKIIEELKKNFTAPIHSVLREQMIESANLLDVAKEDYLKYENKLKITQKFILRSYLYSLSIEKGFTNFNIEKVLDFLELQPLKYIFNRNFTVTSKFEDYLKINGKIEGLFGEKIYNPYMSIESLITANFPKKNVTHSLGMSIMKENSVGIDYPNIIINGK